MHVINYTQDLYTQKKVTQTQTTQQTHGKRGSVSPDNSHFSCKIFAIVIMTGNHKIFHRPCAKQYHINWKPKYEHTELFNVCNHPQKIQQIDHILLTKQPTCHNPTTHSFTGHKNLAHPSIDQHLTLWILTTTIAVVPHH